MTFTKVDKLPRRTNRTGKKCKNPKKRLKEFLEQFLAEDIKIAKVNWNEHDYSDYYVACANIAKSARRHGFPIKVVTRSCEVYLVRTDM